MSGASRRAARRQHNHDAQFGGFVAETPRSLKVAMWENSTCTRLVRGANKGQVRCHVNQASKVHVVDLPRIHADSVDAAALRAQGKHQREMGFKPPSNADILYLNTISEVRLVMDNEDLRARRKASAHAKDLTIKNNPRDVWRKV